MFVQRFQTSGPAKKPKLHWTSIWSQSLRQLKRTRPKPWNCLNVYAHVQWNETCRIHLLLYLHETRQRLLHALELERFERDWIDWKADLHAVYERLPPTQKTKQTKQECIPHSGTWNTDTHQKGRGYLDDLVYLEGVVQDSAYRNVRWFPLCELVFRMMQTLPSVTYSTFLYRETTRMQ